MTAALADAEPDVYDGPLCQGCGGPCWQWKGSVHGFTCVDCLDRYLAEGAAKAAERDRRERARLARSLLRRQDERTPVSADERRREGGGPSYVPHRLPGVA